MELSLNGIKADIQSLNKTVKETSQYYRNRDKELEIIILKSFQQNLEDAGWTVTILDIDKIYSVGGKFIAEWLHAKHGEVTVPILFFLEIKVFTKPQYIRAKEQMTKINTKNFGFYRFQYQENYWSIKL